MIGKRSFAGWFAGMILFLFVCAPSVSGQHVGIKNNLLLDAGRNPNLGVEVATGARTTLDVNGSYNPFTFGGGKKYKHWFVQPEFRYWFCERFNGMFVGGHLHGGQYNFARVRMPLGTYKTLRDHRYEGYFYGAGVSFGNQWMLGKRWNLEASVGVGYARFHYDKYQCGDCGPTLATGNHNYFGPTKITASFIYMLW